MALGADRPALLVSACLLGTRCNHEAGHSRRAAVEALSGAYRLVPVCPEVRAVLKARGPSCGAAEVYDGTFSRTLRSGEGVTAAALRAAGLEVCSEDDLQPLADAEQ